MAQDDSEVESLQREVEYLRSSHVELCREHRAEIKERDERLHKRGQRAEKAERLVATIKRARIELQEDLRIVNDKVEMSGLEVGHLKRELQRAREQNHASKLRIKNLEADLKEASRTNPGTVDLRLKIKRLCKKYHPDHGVGKVCSTEVTRDLVSLLTD